LCFVFVTGNASWIQNKIIIKLCADISHYRKRKRCGTVKELSKRMSHRGPDESDLHVMENGSILSHERLSIIDLHSKTAYSGKCLRS
jgi:asparagine synthase (glutamine-hydrolysing)